MINKIKSKLIDFDPSSAILTSSLKVVVTMILSSTIALHVLNLNQIVVTWNFVYIFFAATSVLLGNVGVRKKAFIYYSISFIYVLFLASELNAYSYFGMVLVVLLSFLVFFVRRFGEEFVIFPPMVMLVFAISLIQIPIPFKMFDELLVSVGISFVIFYFVVIEFMSWDTPRELRALVRQFLKEFYMNSRNYHSFLSVQHNTLLFLSPEASIVKLREESDKLYSMGSKWIIKESRKIVWERIWAYNYMCTNQVLTLREGILKIYELEESKLNEKTEKFEDIIIRLLAFLRVVVYSHENEAEVERHYKLILKTLDELSKELFEDSDLRADTDELKLYMDLWFSVKKSTILLYKVNKNIQLLK